MKIVRCGNGHFYDADKNSTCPYCSGENGNPGYTPGAGSVSRPNGGTYRPGEGSRKTGRSGEMAGSGRALEKPQDRTPVVGWLVCISGSSYGRSFELCAGKNFLGRSERMDIRLPGDPAVAENIHAIITYEPRQGQFFAQPGESRALVYVNDEVVLNDRKIGDHDRLTVGNTTLILVPFCDNRFSWKEQGPG